MRALSFTTHPTGSKTSLLKRQRPSSLVSRSKSSSDKTLIKAGFFDDVLDSLLPKPMSDARKQMEYFDGPGGMLAKINPLSKKPTIEAPQVRLGGSQVLFDFSTMDQQTFQSEFGALNDNVMGGRSDAMTILNGGKAVLKGMTEDQFGGFASMKSRDFDKAINLKEFDGVSVRCKGDGKRYKLILYDTDDAFNVAFHKTFECPNGDDFEDVKLYFKDFKPVQRGRLVEENESEYRLCDGSKVLAVQLMLSKFSYGMDDKNTNYRPGTFEIEVERMEAFKD